MYSKLHTKMHCHFKWWRVISLDIFLTCTSFWLLQMRFDRKQLIPWDYRKYGVVFVQILIGWSVFFNCLLFLFQDWNVSWLNQFFMSGLIYMAVNGKLSSSYVENLISVRFCYWRWRRVFILVNNYLMLNLYNNI